MTLHIIVCNALYGLLVCTVIIDLWSNRFVWFYCMVCIVYVCTVQSVSQMLSFVKDISVVLLCEIEMKRLLTC